MRAVIHLDGGRPGGSQAYAWAVHGTSGRGGPLPASRVTGDLGAVTCSLCLADVERHRS